MAKDVYSNQTRVSARSDGGRRRRGDRVRKNVMKGLPKKAINIPKNW
jgi:hypothetical protein